MKKPLMLLTASIFLLTACGTQAVAPTSTNSNPNTSSQSTPKKPSTPPKPVKIGILQGAPSASYDAAREGFINGLTTAGYTLGTNLTIDVENAEGIAANNDKLVQKMVADHDNLIFAISTPSAQAAAKATKTIPILFTAVSNPVTAHLVDTMAQGKGNISGAVDTHPEMVRDAMQTIRTFFPKSTRVGVIYDSTDPNVRANVADVEGSAQEFSLKPVEVPITTANDVQKAAESLVGKCDAIYLVRGDTVNAGVMGAIEVADAKKVPLFAGDYDSVKKGAFASFGVDYNALGQKNAEQAIKIFGGAKPGEVPVKIPDNIKLTLNLKAAAAEGITVTDDMKNGADIIGN